MPCAVGFSQRFVLPFLYNQNVGVFFSFRASWAGKGCFVTNVFVSHLFPGPNLGGEKWRLTFYKQKTAWSCDTRNGYKTELCF